MNVTKQLLTVKTNQRVLVVEDSVYRLAWFAERLGNDLTDFAPDPESALEFLKLNDARYNIVFLDHDAGVNEHGPQDFMSVAKALREAGFSGEVIIHSMNYQAAMRMQHTMRNGKIITFGSFELRRQ